MAFSPMKAGQGIASAVGSYGKSSQESKGTQKEPQHRNYQPVLKAGKEAPGTTPPGDLMGEGKRGIKKVKKTGGYKLHKGERVLTKKQAKKYSKK